MSTCHSPCFLPPTRLSRPFCCSLPITNFTPSSVISPRALAASTLVPLGLFLKNSSTFFWVASKSFWVVLSLFWVAHSSFWVVLISFKDSFWVVISLFWVVLSSLDLALQTVTLNSFALSSLSNCMSGYSARIRTIPEPIPNARRLWQRWPCRDCVDRFCHCECPLR